MSVGLTLEPATSSHECSGYSTIDDSTEASPEPSASATNRAISSTSNTQRVRKGVAIAERRVEVTRKSFAPHCVS
eukprot:CAMPEP_0181171926 /NCGR_PEP_ID=MMETSP1096-20121128/2175_1 /TAXON_ID=156174 ORGANISM="Chrysochromulina ericina, Strain CCMP281" /NCGR_SAMPLE_ID=MMETSP1096 /ASSEMBLY_ACC=CAM_ASM_000453 /LENGTH=74 /DNA_ID=CAMNT_0023259617 /DNA_START=688 /DNA_END=912 /DNA_ORIENTATION=-